MPTNDGIHGQQHTNIMAIAKNPQFHDCTKHIDVKYHFLRRKVEEEVIESEYVPTGEQVADTLTKALNRESERRHC